MRDASNTRHGPARQWLVGLARLPSRVHHDQRGTISIVSVFTLLLLVMLMGMVINTGQQVDHKVRLQNAADAATYSGGVVLTRSMNSLAFTNHLLSETFALTAFFREASARRAESLTPEILDNWERIGRFMFSPSEFTKFAELGLAINEKIPPNRAVDGDREMIFTFSEWAAAGAELMLPVFEGILYEGLIPRFQVALVETTPQMVQTAADETAQRHGRSWPRPVVLRGAIWRTIGDPVAGASEVARGTLPVVDPINGTELDMPFYFSQAKSNRDRLAEGYLNQWNNAVLRHFDYLGKMNQFSNLWRIFTRGELDRLLNQEYPISNMPHVLRTNEPQESDLEQDYMFVGVVYKGRRGDLMSVVFENPIGRAPQAPDTLAFAQLMVFVPERRLVWWHYTDSPPEGLHGGGIPGLPNPFPDPDPDPNPAPPGDTWWDVVLQHRGWHDDDWTLFNQNWSTQLTPA
ncbi:MAG: hypothetical protein FJ276_31575, partial [Planctomycetes bacterium]|nr:hypothetical protein [Planctomycetota bacterium]